MKMVATHRQKITAAERKELKRHKIHPNPVIVLELIEFSHFIRNPTMREDMLNEFRNHIKDCNSWYCQALRGKELDTFDLFLYELNEINGLQSCQLN